jgi:hypothetical protein
MTYFSLFQQVTGSDLNTLQRDTETEVRQLKSQIQQLESQMRQLESSIASTKSTLQHEMVMAEIATKHDIVMAGYATETSILKFLGFLVLCVVGTLIAVIAIDAIVTFIIENR